MRKKQNAWNYLLCSKNEGIRISLRTFKLIVTLLMMFSLSGLLLAQTGTTQPAEPSNFHQSNAGSKQNPYRISSLANLRWLSEYSGEVDMGFKYFEQTANIDASETISWNDGKGFKPIGHGEYVDWYGLGNRFAGEYNGAGYTISGIYINMSATGTYLGVGLFGNVYPESTIKNLTLDNINITATTDYYNSYAGAIAGTLRDDSFIINCHATVNITASSGNANSYAGGLVGGLIVNSSIQRSSTSGYVNGDIAGGLVGDAWGGTLTIISHSSSTIDVEGSLRVGGIAGVLSSEAQIFQCEASGSIVGNGGYDQVMAGGIVGVLHSQATIKHGSFTGSVYASGRRAYAGGVVGQVHYESLIENSEAEANIEAFETEDYEGYWEGSGAGGVVGNLYRGNIKNCDFTGTVKSNYAGGGIAGSAYIGRIENSKADGMIILDEVIHENGFAGGIVGRIIFVAGAEFLIARCHSNMDITATANGLYVGGIIGQVYNLTVENCHANGTIITNILGGRSESLFIGGLAGSSGRNSVIKHSYNTLQTNMVSIPLNANIGGIAGNLNDRAPDSIPGENLLNVSLNIWDMEVFEIDTDVAFNESEGYVAENLGLFTVEMKTSAPYIQNGWDFDNVWAIDPAINDGYPYLRSEENTEPTEFYPPHNLSAIQVGETIYLEWNLPIPRQLTSFRVYRDGFQIAANINSTDFVDDDIENNTEYTYTVLAVYQNPTGISEESDEVAIHTMFSPREITYTFDENDNVELFWLAPNGGSVNGYLVYRDDDQLTSDPITELTFTDTNTHPITIYTYKITAVYDNGQSPPIQITLCSSETPVNPPRNLIASTKNGFVELRWYLPEVVPGFIGLYLSHFDVYSNGDLLAEQVMQTVYNDITAQNQASYVYTITAVYTYQDSELTSENSNPAEITVYYPVRNLTASSILHDVRLNWSSPQGGNISGYNVYRNDMLLNQSPLINATFTDDDTTPAEHYTYGVTVVYDDVESEAVDISIIIPLFSPVRELVAEVNINIVTLSWEEPIEVLDFEILLGYKVYRDDILLTAELIDELTFEEFDVPEGEYVYKVIAVYELGDSKPVEINATVDPVPDSDVVDLIWATELIGNYPNPFNPETTISLTLAVESMLRIEIYNIKGQKVRTLVNREYIAGKHNVVWNGTDDNGLNVASGVYFYQLRVGEITQTKRMLLMK